MRTPVKISPEIRDLGLEPYLLELEVDGLTVVPPEVTGVGLDRIDHMVELILERAREMTGSEFTQEQGPLVAHQQGELVVPGEVVSRQGKHVGPLAHPGQAQAVDIGAELHHTQQ